MDFANRTVIVTGGTGALGRAVVGALLAAGARCRVPYILDAEAAAFPHHDNVTLVPAIDLSDEPGVARLYDGVTDLWASIHIAGGFAMGNVADTDKPAMMYMLNTNFASCYLCCRAALHSFTAAGAPGRQPGAPPGGRPGGRIVNVTARPGIEPRLGAGMAAYAASKAAVAAFTQALAAEVAGQGILVNAVAPSIIDTPVNRAAMPNADHAAWPKPEEIAATIAFLASPENRVTTGAIVPVPGRT
jgi:NAD(P)-dependent dehydrogenase (short-subunit alcohol dehydrogenase family)